MSYSSGPCPKCGKETMYDYRTPTLCNECRNPKKQINTTHRLGNRKQRRANKK